jgi:hypothetical protein
MSNNLSFRKYIFIIFVNFFFLFCGGSKFLKTEKVHPNYIEDSPVLTKMEGSKDILIYRYSNQNIKESHYSSVILDPISINQNQIDPKFTPMIDKITNIVESSLKNKLAQKSISTTEEVSDTTARISIFVSAAKIKPEGIKPWNLLPLSALITASVYVAGYNPKSIDLLMECKITNSESNELLTKDIITLSSDKFRNKNKTLEIFTIMNNKVLDQIFNLSILPIFNK